MTSAIGLDSLLDLAHEAVDLARPHFLSLPKTVTLKTERDMVTDIDKAIESELRSFLRERAPNVGFIGEEGGVWRQKQISSGHSTPSMELPTSCMGFHLWLCHSACYKLTIRCLG